MMFWMAYGAGSSASGSRCMRGCNKASNRIWRRQGVRCFLINVYLARSAGIASRSLGRQPACSTFLWFQAFFRDVSRVSFRRLGAIVAELLKRWQQWNDMPEKRFLALLKSIELWAITVFLILLGGSVGVFEGTKTHPIDWSLCFFVGVGAISTVRNF